MIWLCFLKGDKYMSNTLRDLALKAKNRLKAISAQNCALCALEEDIKEEKSHTNAYLSARANYAIVANNSKIEGDPLFNTVKNLLQKDDVSLNPISYLIDHKIYNQLSQTEKEKYILKLTKRYALIKNYILNNFADEIHQETQ